MTLNGVNRLLYRSLSPLPAMSQNDCLLSCVNGFSTPTLTAQIPAHRLVTIRNKAAVFPVQADTSR